MSEVRLDFAYPVPPDRLWQALTDRTQLAVWFMENDFAPEPGRRFLLWPNQVDLIDGPINGVVLEVVPARRLVLGWQAGGMHSTVTWQLTPAGYGTRLRVNQSGVLGSAERVRELGTQYRRLFGERLFALVCAGGVGFTGGDGRAGSAGGNATGAEQMGRPPQRFRRWAAVAAVVILAIAGLVWLSRPERAWLGVARAGPGVVGVGPAPTVSAGASAWPGTGAGTGPGVPSPTQPGTSATATPAPPQTAALTIAYAVTTRTLLSYTVEVVIANPGDLVRQWQVITVRLGQLDLQVRPDGTTVRHEARSPDHCFFATDASADVPAGGEVRFTFTVTSAVGGVLGGVTSVQLDGGVCAPAAGNSSA